MEIPATCHKSDIPNFAELKGATNSKPFTIDGTTYSAGTLRFDTQKLSANVSDYPAKEQVYSGVYVFSPCSERGVVSCDFNDLPSYEVTTDGSK